MGREPEVQGNVFLDAAYAIALAAPSDQLHSWAVDLAQQLEENQTRMVTTQAVLLEIGNALSKLRYRAAAVELLSSLEADPAVEIVPLSAGLYTEAFDLFRERPDKEWGLIDCVSFVVMKSREITEALTADEHFEQYGFRALLREP
jgi:predicted nucleic acid-binding protein